MRVVGSSNVTHCRGHASVLRARSLEKNRTWAGALVVSFYVSELIELRSIRKRAGNAVLEVIDVSNHSSCAHFNYEIEVHV
jgi:hypothetical protein